ncbi:MAG: hypothetical protein ACTSVI_15915 [Promethearchaeota archaeon]
MSSIQDFENLSDYFDKLLIDFFPENFDLVSWEGIVDAITELTKLINKTLNFYHTITDNDKKILYSPTLNYAHSVLAHMSRLAKFEQKSLTKYNQLVVDLKSMLEHKNKLIETKFREQAEYQLRILNDDKLKELAERFLKSMI